MGQPLSPPQRPRVDSSNPAVATAFQANPRNLGFAAVREVRRGSILFVIPLGKQFRILLRHRKTSRASQGDPPRAVGKKLFPVVSTHGTKPLDHDIAERHDTFHAKIVRRIPVLSKIGPERPQGVASVPQANLTPRSHRTAVGFLGRSGSAAQPVESRQEAVARLVRALEPDDILASSHEISHFTIGFSIPERQQLGVALVCWNLARCASFRPWCRPCTPRYCNRQSTAPDGVVAEPATTVDSLFSEHNVCDSPRATTTSAKKPVPIIIVTHVRTVVGGVIRFFEQFLSKLFFAVYSIRTSGAILVSFWKCRELYYYYL